MAFISPNHGRVEARIPINGGRSEPVKSKQGEIIGKVYPVSEIEYPIYSKVHALIDDILFPKHGRDPSRLTEILTTLWQENKDKFTQELDPYIRNGNIEKIAYHIFNLYRRQELDVILKILAKNPERIDLTPSEWDDWKESVSKWGWRYIKNMHSLPIDSAMEILLQKEFPSIFPPNYSSDLGNLSKHLGKELPKLRRS